MNNSKRNEIAKLKFFLYPVYTLLLVMIAFIFIDRVIATDYQSSFLQGNLPTVASWIIVVIDVAVVCNLILYKNRNRVSNRFFVKNLKFIMIVAGAVTGVLVSGVAYTCPPVASIFAPTISSYTEPSKKALGEDMIGLKQDIDFLVGTSGYSALKNTFSNRDIEINNSMFTLHEFQPLKNNIADGIRTFIINGEFNRVSPPESVVSSIVGGEGESQDQLAARLNILNPNSILGYSEISGHRLREYTEFSFSAKLSGDTGQCFSLFHRTERILKQYNVLTGELTGKPKLEMEDPQSEEFCIDNDSKRSFSNTIFFKEDYLDDVNKIEFWLVPVSGNNVDVKVNQKSSISLFSIFDENVFGFRQSKENDSTRNLNSRFCIEGFHKGVPDYHAHMMENSASPSDNLCPGD